MKSNFRKDTILNSAVLFAAWLVVISASVGENFDSAAQPVPIAYPAY